MPRYNYEYETSPRKVKPREKNKSIDLEERYRINEEQRKNSIEMEKKKHNENVVLILVIFLMLLVVSYRSSLINEKFNEIQDRKDNLAAIMKTNNQLEVSIEGTLNLGNIEQEAQDKLGMQRLNNSQKVYVTLDKKDYTKVATNKIEITQDEEIPWYKKIINKILGK